MKKEYKKSVGDYLYEIDVLITQGETKPSKILAQLCKAYRERARYSREDDHQTSEACYYLADDIRFACEYSEDKDVAEKLRLRKKDVLKNDKDFSNLLKAFFIKFPKYYEEVIKKADPNIEKELGVPTPPKGYKSSFLVSIEDHIKKVKGNANNGEKAASFDRLVILMITSPHREVLTDAEAKEFTNLKQVALDILVNRILNAVTPKNQSIDLRIAACDALTKFDAHFYKKLNLDLLAVAKEDFSAQVMFELNKSNLQKEACQVVAHGWNLINKPDAVAKKLCEIITEHKDSSVKEQAKIALAKGIPFIKDEAERNKAIQLVLPELVKEIKGPNTFLVKKAPCELLSDFWEALSNEQRKGVKNDLQKIILHGGQDREMDRVTLLTGAPQDRMDPQVFKKLEGLFTEEEVKQANKILGKEEYVSNAPDKKAESKEGSSAAMKENKADEAVGPSPSAMRSGP